MRRLDLSWKCPVCKMHQRKEPHRRLSDHMEAAHDMVWSETENKYVKFASVNSEREFIPHDGKTPPQLKREDICDYQLHDGSIRRHWFGSATGDWCWAIGGKIIMGPDSVVAYRKVV